jgi:hypothetical protein
LNSRLPLLFYYENGTGSKSVFKDHCPVPEYVAALDAAQYFFWYQTWAPVFRRGDNYMACGLLSLHDCELYLGGQVYLKKMEGNA